MCIKMLLIYDGRKHFAQKLKFCVVISRTTKYISVRSTFLQLQDTYLLLVGAM